MSTFDGIKIPPLGRQQGICKEVNSDCVKVTHPQSDKEGDQPDTSTNLDSTSSGDEHNEIDDENYIAPNLQGEVEDLTSITICSETTSDDSRNTEDSYSASASTTNKDSDLSISSEEGQTDDNSDSSDTGDETDGADRQKSDWIAATTLHTSDENSQRDVADTSASSDDRPLVDINGDPRSNDDGAELTPTDNN